MINIETFFRNHFNTKEISDDRMDLFTQDHIARLKANNPENIYDVVITKTEGAHNGYFSAKTTESVSAAQKEAATVNVEKYAKEFIDMVSMKEGIIRGTWGKDSAAYQEFYPHGITEYIKATRANMNGLMERFLQGATKYAGELPANFIDLFNTIITNYQASRDLQLGKMGDVSGDKLATAQSRDILEKQLMSNVLVIANNNIGKPEVMKVYFTQHYIERSGRSQGNNIPPEDYITGTVAPNDKTEILHGGFSGDSEFHFKNTGETTLQFYTANMPDDPIPGTVLEIAAGQDETAFASALGSEENMFLMVYNVDYENEGEFGVGEIGG
ncbi:MAG: hypothetical protein JEY97_10300 [Bacteroidales bacterium]|nr:hypothetical protein [Bacteroidales bacterium]